MEQLFPPPPKFRAVQYVQWAEFTWQSPWKIDAKRATNPTFARGLRYEAYAHAHFQELFPPKPSASRLYVPAQWIRFVDLGATRWAQPDGLLLDFERAQITIIEMKLRHTLAAWWGLRKLYEPLIRYLFGSRWRYAVCEVVRWFDPAVPWPEPLVMTPSLAAVGTNQFGVHIWSGSR